MSKISSAKILAEIAEISARIYGIVIDKDLAKKNAEKDRKIKELEAQLAELKREQEKSDGK